MDSPEHTCDSGKENSTTKNVDVISQPDVVLSEKPTKGSIVRYVQSKQTISFALEMAKRATW